MRVAPRCRSLVLAAALATGGAAHAQVPAPAGQDCPPCRLDLREVLVLDPGPAAPGIPTAWARAPDGRIFVVSTRAPFEIAVFSASGGYLTTLGGDGSDVGAFREIGALATRADTLAAFDVRTREVTLLDVQGLPVRRVPVGVAAADVAPARDGGWWIAGRAAGADTVGRPLHRVRPDGTLESSHGDPAPMDWRGYEPLRREIALAPDGTLWAARRHAYVLARRDGSGTSLSELDLTGPDFPARERPLPVRPDQPAGPRVADLRVTADGRLLVLQHLASSTWASALSGSPSPSPEGAVHEILDPDAAWDSRVELLDTAGMLLADGTTQVLLHGFVDDSTALGYAEAEGSPRWSLWRVAVAPSGDLRTAEERSGPSVPRLALWFVALGLSAWLLAGRVWRSSG